MPGVSASAAGDRVHAIKSCAARASASAATARAAIGARRIEVAARRTVEARAAGSTRGNHEVAIAALATICERGRHCGYRRNRGHADEGGASQKSRCNPLQNALCRTRRA
jgi:hypothetical protein